MYLKIEKIKNVVPFKLWHHDTKQQLVFLLRQSTSVDRYHNVNVFLAISEQAEAFTFDFLYQLQNKLLSSLWVQ